MKKWKGELRVFLILLMLASISSCRLFHASTKLAITAVDSTGEPIEGAEVRIQKKSYGTTNSKGQLEIAAELEAEIPLLVEVSKSSNSLYYAPYFENIKVIRGEDNQFRLKATLFAVKNAVDSDKKPQITQVDEKSGNPDLSDSLANTTQTDRKISIDLDTNDTQSKEIELYSIPTKSNSTEFASTSSDGGRIVTIYLEANSQLIANSGVFFADPQKHQWIEGCTTNLRGRCSFSLPADFPEERISILARAEGYVSQVRTVALAQGDKFRFEMEKGASLDIFTLQRRYNATYGLKGVAVELNGQSIGSTDDFGFFSYKMSSIQGQEASLTLKSSNALPRERKHTLAIGSSSFTIVQNYLPASAPKPRLFVLPIVQIGDHIGPRELSWEALMMKGLRENIANSKSFEEVDLDKLGPLLSKLNLSPKQVAREGWSETELSSEVEYVLRPYLKKTNNLLMELSLIDPQARIIAATKKVMPLEIDEKKIPGIIKQMYYELSSKVSFQGSILASDTRGFRINLSPSSGQNISKGSRVKVYRSDFNSSLSGSNWMPIADGKVTDMTEGYSLISIESTANGQVVNLGDGVKIEPMDRRFDTENTISLTDKQDDHPLTQANFYWNDKWIMASDTSGKISLPEELKTRRGVLEILKTGYKSIEMNTPVDMNSIRSLKLQREFLIVKVESVPEQASVRINGRLLGRTPLYQSIEPFSADAVIQVALESFRDYEAKVVFSEEGLDLTGEKAIHLERDLRKEARRFRQEGQPAKAAEILETISPSDKEFLLALHDAGEIYLNDLQDPIKAYQTFRRINQQPGINNFSDSRFIGSHINEGIALFHTGERFSKTDPQKSVTFWKEAEGIFERTTPQIHNISQEKYTLALNTLGYYHALTLHKLGYTNKDLDGLKKARDAWKSYIETTATSNPSDKNSGLIKKAEFYLKQAEESLIQANSLATTPNKDINRF